MHGLLLIKWKLKGECAFMEILGILSFVGFIMIVVTVFSIEAELKKLVKQNNKIIELLERKKDKE